jgi:hypothetical protein
MWTKSHLSCTLVSWWVSAKIQPQALPRLTMDHFDSLIYKNTKTQNTKTQKHNAAKLQRCKNKTTNYKLQMSGGGFFEVAGGNWGRLEAPQQHRQPPVEPPTPDSTDPKTSAKLGVTSTSSRSSSVRTPDLRTSWTPQRNSTKTYATFSKEPPLHLVHTRCALSSTVINSHQDVRSNYGHCKV